MDWQQVSIAMALVSAVTSVSLALVGWLLRKSDSGPALIPFALATTLWSLVYVWELAGVALKDLFFFDDLAHLSILIIVPTWLILVLSCTGKKHWLSHPIFWGSLLFPAITFAFLLNNPLHSLPWLPHTHDHLPTWESLSTVGQSVVWLHTAYFYAGLHVASILLARAALRMRHTNRRQAGLLGLSAVLPWVSLIAHLPDPTHPLDITPFTFAMAGVLLGWVLLNADYVLSNMAALRRSVIVEMQDGVIVLDKRGRVIDVNPAAERLVNASASMILGKTPDLAFHRSPAVLGLFEQLKSQLTTTEIRGQAALSEGDNPIHIELTLAPLAGNSDDDTGILLTLHDITSLKQAQLTAARRLDELTALRDVDTQISSTLDVDLVLETALASAVRLSGADGGFITLVEGASQMIVQVAGRYAEADYLNATIPQNIGIIGRVIQQMEAELVCDVQYDPDYHNAVPGTQAQMSIPLINHDSVVGTLNLETTEPSKFTQETFEFIKLLAARIAGAIENAQLYSLSLKHMLEIKSTYDQVRNLEQLKTEMIRVASHDLKSPLHIIMGYLSMLDSDSARVAEDHQQFIQEMYRQSERMLQIINDILSMERLQGEMIHEPIDMCSIITQTIADLEIQARQKAQTIETHIDLQGVIVNGDSVQLREAVNNLIGNAIKYTPDGGKITIRLGLRDERVVFEVKDTGYGIPEDRQRRLFQPFYRAKVEGTEEILGTGLGLHLVKGIVDRHGGEVRFNSVYGKGSTFGFDLPRTL